MAWNKRGFTIYPVGLVENLPDVKQNTAALFSQIGGLESLADEMAMFDLAMKLSNDDGKTVTHRCINTVQTDAMYAGLKQAFQARAAQLVGLVWFVVDSRTHELLDTNTDAELGVVMTLDDVLAREGLTKYKEALE